ncbi:MAG: hypothetical protein AB7H77_04290 [Bdellovibrionales bacterium]
MIIPDWAIFGLLASFLAALQPLTQEKYKAEPFALAMAIKVVMVLVTLPFVITQGLPTAPVFYLAICFTAVIWCISDVYYYRAVQVVGAGPVSRILPATAILTFVAWFFFDPALLDRYFAAPWVGAAITGCILMATFFATCLTRCMVSRQAVRLLWFVMLASAMDPIATKLILHSAGAAKQAPFAYVFVEAVLMLVLWSGYGAVKKPVALSAFVSPTVIKAGLMIGALNATRLILQNFAYMDVENPTYLRVMMFTDALWIILIYKLVGRREEANVKAGLGIVAAAAGLVLLKSL